MVNFKEKISNLPDEAGVYIMKNSLNQIIYIGKAKSLKKRVSQYFNKQNQALKVKHMVENISDFEYIIVDNEVEALVLEQSLIKKNKPKYNILLRDDKQYPYIKLTVAEAWPRVLKTRRIVKDGSKYFGPYPNATAVNDVIELLNEIYSIRKCNMKIDSSTKRNRPCLNYYIGKCLAPCSKIVDKDEYINMISEISSFLEGNTDTIKNKSKSLMMDAAMKQDYETAAYYRDKLIAIEYLNERQIVDSLADTERDIIGIASGIEYACAQVFFVRSGKIIGRENYFIDNNYGDSTGEILSTFIKQFYIGSSYIPKEVIIDEKIEDKILIEKWLTDKKGNNVSITIPIKGEKKDLVKLARKNALETVNKYSQENIAKHNTNMTAVSELAELLSLSHAPKRIECYDISHISGVEAVGSMVVFENGTAKKSDYRRFRIKSFSGNDDYRSMGEVLTRRLDYLIKDNEINNKSIQGFCAMPDLICIDGGKGQLSVVSKILEEKNLNIEIVGLVKDDDHNMRAILYKGKEYSLPKNSSIYRLLFAIQEEAHRFAISYHRSLHSGVTFKSELDEIKGIGSKRKKALLTEIGDISKIKTASVEELKEVSFMNEKVALDIFEYFRSKNKEG